MMRSVIGKVLRCRKWPSNLYSSRKVFTVRPIYSNSIEPNIDYNNATKMTSFVSDCDTQSRIYHVATYEDVRDVPKKNNVWLIDVRDKHEIERCGGIPCAINIPLDDLAAAFQFTGEYFFNRYGATKPFFDSEIIFTCRSGRRSKIAYELAESMGYKNLKNFDGGWLLYEERCDFN